MWTPFMVGYWLRPALSGIVLTTCPLLVTVITWLATSAVLIWALPTVKWIDWLVAAPPPLPASTPCRFAVSVTCSPAGQYVWGRKWSSLSLNQCQPPGTGTDSVTWSAATTAALLTTLWLKRNWMGMPTPTVSPCVGKMVVDRTDFG